MMVAAALSAKRDSTDHPCAESPVDLWWGKSVGNWRDCFESLTSGDFLTANFFGLTFNDMFPFGPWRDRAAVLEDAWTKRFSEIVTRGELRARLHEAIPQCRTLLIKVRVWPQYENGSKKSKAVSMSWWLSKPIQRHLHQQTEAGKNKNFNAPHLDAMWQLIKTGCT